MEGVSHLPNQQRRSFTEHESVFDVFRTDCCAQKIQDLAIPRVGLCELSLGRKAKLYEVLHKKGEQVWML